MKKLFLLLALALFVSCSNNVKEDNITELHRTIVIDSCEYIIYDYESGYQGYAFMAHKGNCIYCAERHDK